METNFKPLVVSFTPSKVDNSLTRTPLTSREKCQIKMYEEKKERTQSYTDCDINPLALPRGKVHYCEICMLKCWFHCPRCKSVFYCSREHRDIHNKVIHRDICDRIAFLLRPKYPLANEERGRFMQQETIVRQEIAEFAKHLAILSMCRDQDQDALLQLNTAIRYEDKFMPNGCESIKLMKIHILYSELHMKRGDMIRAQVHFKKAQAIVDQQEQSCVFQVRPNMCKVEGIYNLAFNKIDDAIYCFANEAFYAEKNFHTKHPRFAISLFHLGQAFVQQKKYQTALSNFTHATDIWTFQVNVITQNFLKRMEEQGLSSIMRTFILSKEQKESGMFSSEDKKDFKNAMQYLTNDALQKSLQINDLQKIIFDCAMAMAEYLHSDFQEAADIAMKCKKSLEKSSVPQDLLIMLKNLYRASNKQLHKPADFKDVLRKVSTITRKPLDVISSVRMAKNIEKAKARFRRESVESSIYSKAQTDNQTVMEEDEN